ncbi:MAG TPA: hypothetical protein PK431_06310 [Chitinophagales bacterium]|nr:hypothetical protein [Chitinophagales bacterium]
MKFKLIFSSTLILFLSYKSFAQFGSLKSKVKETTKEAKPVETPKVTENATSTVAKAAGAGIFIWPQGSINLIFTDAYTIPMHQKSIGKIVFSNQKITQENTSEALLKTTFKLDDAIYGRVFTETSVKNYALYRDGDVTGSAKTNDKSYYFIKIFIDGAAQKFLFNSDDNGGKYETWNTWQIFVAAKGDDAKNNRAHIVEALNKLSPGKHTIKLQLFGGESGIDYTIKPIAEGEFTLDVEAGKSMKIGKNWASYKAAMVNPALEKQIVDVVNKYATKQGWKETFTKAKILDADWYVTKNEWTGIPLYRTINVVVYAKWPDGHCTAQEFSVIQNYNDGAFSKVTEYNALGNQDRIDCE